jgi:alpha-galactosidase
MGKFPKVAVIGAGSISHGKRLIDDLLTVRELEGGQLALMGANIQRLEVVGHYARRAAAVLMPSLEILILTERKRALMGADLAFSLFDVGGFPAFDLDYRIAGRYGLDICIGDTVGPLGTMRALRNGPVMLSLADEMAELCPEALLVNYVNPMAPMVAAASSRGIECVGICGGVEATRAYAACVLGLDAGELDTSFAGVNHLCWLLEIAGPGGDLYPRFRERMRDPEIRGEESARFEMLQQFGYLATESSGHISDFFPWFRRSPELRERYCSAPGYSGASGAYHKRSSFVQRHLGDEDFLECAEPSISRSSDYGPAIVEAALGGKSRRIHGNVMNGRGSQGTAISKLPSGACVELPIIVEARRLTVPEAPPLPTALAALCAPSAIQHILVLEALLSEDPELVFAAFAQDRLTASVLDLPSMRSLASELLVANAAYISAGFAKGLGTTVDAARRPLRRREEKGDPTIDMVRACHRRRREGRGGSEPNRGS